MSRPAVKRKLSCKSLHEKYQALKDLENGASNKTVAAKFNVPRNTISTWVKNKDKILKAYEEGNSPKTQKLRTSDHDQLDRALYKWFVGVRGQGIPVSGPIVKRKAAKMLKN